MARHDAKLAAPDYTPKDATMRPKCARQYDWDRKNTPNESLLFDSFAYLDRISPEMFVGRCHHGVCNAIPDDIVERAPGAVYPVVAQVEARNHAYIITITPHHIKSVCIYCGGTINGYPQLVYNHSDPPLDEHGHRPLLVNLENIPWDEPWDGPRRATQRELDAVGLILDMEPRLLYLDAVDDRVLVGRIRVGECKNGGPHEAILSWWHRHKDPMFSYCAFCDMVWYGPPDGYWDAVEPHTPTIQQVIKQHEEDMRLGKY